MAWLKHHRESEQLASDAQLAWREGRREAAQDLYSRAADAEDRAIAELDHSKARTLGISSVSAASLYYKAAQYLRAEEVAARWLGEPIPAFAKDQLRSLLQSVWAEQVRGETNAGFAPGQVLVSVRGGEVVHGGAPLDLITSKMRVVESIYHRTAEFLAGISHRRRGQPSKQIQENCRPWLFQTAAGSYQFAVAVQKKDQLELFDSPLAPEKIADCFLSVLRAGIDDPDEGLSEIVPDSDYRNTFLKLTRNLAPRGQICESIEIRSADEPGAVRLDSEARKCLTRTIRKLKNDHGATGQQETLNGTLRALHLDKDWLEVVVGGDPVKVHGVGEQVDDLIGPMVNKPVVVHVVDKNGKKSFLDIEPDD